MVHWRRGLPSVSETHQITLLSLFFKLSSCARFTYTLLLVWDVARHGISTPFLKNMFFVFRYSFCHTSYLYPLPFSATSQIIENHTRYYHAYLMKQLYFVCKRCWTYSRHVAVLHEPCWGCYILESTAWDFWMFILISLFSDTNQLIETHTRDNSRGNMTGQLFFVCRHCWLYLRNVITLHEPCRGCAILESMGWEFWTPSRGRSAWRRHPCWMFILIFFIRFPSEPRRWNPQNPYRLCIVHSQGRTNSFKLSFFSLDCHRIIDHALIFRGWPIPHQLCIVLR